MATLFFFASLIVFCYAAFIKGRFDVTSISESYYKLSEIKPNYGYIFSAWCVAPAFLLFPIWVDIMPEEWQFVAFLSVICLGAVGCAPRYLTSQKIVHFVFSGLALVLSVASCAIMGLWYIPAILLVGTGAWVIIKKRPDFLYGLEVAAFMAIYIAISIKN